MNNPQANRTILNASSIKFHIISTHPVNTRPDSVAVYHPALSRVFINASRTAGTRVRIPVRAGLISISAIKGPVAQLGFRALGF